MTEKVKLTKELADAIEKAKGIFNLGAFVKFANEELKPLSNYTLLLRRELDKETLLQAVFFGYEVEPQYKVGDWVVSKSDTENRIKVIKTVNGEGITACGNSSCVSTHFSNFRHATPEEIKAVKESQLWKSIGREVGEFKNGDIRILDNGNSVHITDVDYARSKYIQGSLKGFYPVESFISFEEVKS